MPARGRSIRTSLLRLSAGTVAAFVVVFAAGSFAVASVLHRYETEAMSRGVARARRLLEHEVETRAATVREYAWWTDTWTYIDAPRTAQAESFIRDNFVDWIPSHYGEAFIGIWSLDRRPVFLWSDSSAQDIAATFARPEVFDLLARVKSVAGLVATPRGLYLASLSVVVRTDDQTASGPWHGYVVFARPVTAALLEEWSDALQERIVLRPPADLAGLAGDTLFTRLVARGDSVEALFPVSDFFGRPVATAVLSVSREFEAGMQRWILTVILSASAVGLAAIAFIWFLGLQTFVHPLERLAVAFAGMRSGGQLAVVEAPARAREWVLFAETFNLTVTAMRASEERLRKSQKMEVLGRLAGGIAHDFNNLLGAVLASVSTLRAEIDAAHPAQASAQTIERAARRAAELTRQLLSFARREDVRREPVVVEDVIAAVRNLCGRTIAHAMEVRIDLAARGATVLGDAGQLEQALLNLCLNARDAMPDGGVLTLRLGVEELSGPAGQDLADLPAGSYAVLGVEDTGVGILPEVRAHLFEPFFTTKGRGKGTGLGLATSYGIVRSYGGRIRVRSEVGAGSCFEIVLPLSKAVRPAETLPEGAVPPGTETVLLVDDDEDLRRALSRSLGRLGYTVIQAANGREAMDLFTAQSAALHLVLLDVQMPEMGGVETFRAMRAVRPTVPILAISGHASGEEIQRLVEGGVEAVLPKPFGIPELAVAIRRILDRATPEA